MIVVSYYTPFYEKPAGLLRQDLDAAGMRHDLCMVQDRGSWRRNVLYKPEFILGKLRETGEDVLFLDADTRVRGPLEFPPNCDMAIRYSSIPSKNDPHPKNQEPLCGAIFLRNNETVRNFFESWISKLGEADPTLRRPEQQILKGLLKDTDLKVHKLPPEYGKRFGEHVPDAIIVHGRWTDEAGTPPESEAVKEEREESREENRRIKGIVSEGRKDLLRRKMRSHSGWFWNKYRIPHGHMGALSLTFDDGRASQFDVAVPALDEFGMKGTFYICPGNVQKQRSGWKRPAGNVIELASWREITKASGAGHEIGNHTYSHHDIGKLYDGMEPKKRHLFVKQEIAGAASAIANRIGRPWFSFAWPYHKPETRLDEMIHKNHTGIRQLQPRGVYNMKAATSVWRRRLKDWVDYLIEKKMWGQAAIHDVGDSGHEPLPADILRWHLEDLVSRGNILVTTVTAMYEALLPPPPPPRPTKRKLFIETPKGKKRKPKPKRDHSESHRHFKRRGKR